MARNKRKHISKKRSLPKVTFHKLDWLETLSLVACGWFWLYPHPYKVAFTVVLILPIVGLILNGISKPSIASLVSISQQDKEEKYDVADFLDLPAVAITVRVLLDYEFESFYSILKVGTIGFALLLAVLAISHRAIADSNKNKWNIYFFVIGNVALYSYAATYGVNCIYDDSAPKVYHTEVLDKKISRSKRVTRYKLQVAPWGHHKDKEWISVTASQYKETDKGHTVSVDYKEGFLGIPWYYVE